MKSLQVVTETSTGDAVRFRDDEVKHLELVQSVIARLAQNCFHIKGWSVSVATAIIAFAAKESSPGLAILALFPALSFWCLDAYYLRQERLYRKLYDAIADPGTYVQPFSMSTSEYRNSVQSWSRTLFARTVLPLHGVIVLLILAEITAFLVVVSVLHFKS